MFILNLRLKQPTASTNYQTIAAMKKKYTIWMLGILCFLPTTVLSQNLIVSELSPQEINQSENSTDRNFDVFQERYVSIDLRVLQQDEINFNLFDGQSFVALRDESVKSVQEADWIGRLAGFENGYALITQREDRFYAKIETGLQQFFIYSIGEDSYKVVEVNKDTAKEELLDDGLIAEQVDNLDVCAAADTCAPVCVSVMVVYTPGARTNLGGTAADAEAAIGAAMNEFNLVLDNTGVSHDVCLVHVDEVAYTHSGSTSTDVTVLRNQTDGIIDNVHTLRDTHFADLVHMIVEGGCGSGWVNNDPNNYRDDLGFAVTSDNCMTTNLTFPHEAGHNMGLQHDWFQNQDTDPCEWHHGFVNNGDPGDRWRTVMAYNNECSASGTFCPRQAYFSNPANTFGPNSTPMGVPIGSTEPSDSFFGLERAMCEAAAFRVPGPLPVEMVSFSSLVNRNEVELTWSTRTEVNNLGFAIEHSQAGSPFTEIAFVDGVGNSLEIQDYSYTVRHLELGSHLFRLRQQDFDGSFSFSEIVENSILLPEGHVLNAAYPNPFNPNTTVTFAVAESTPVLIQLVNIYGQVVREVYNATPAAQELQEIQVRGEGLASGVYHLVMTHGITKSAQKIVLQK